MKMLMFPLESRLNHRDKTLNMLESKKHEDWDATFDPYHKLFLGSSFCLASHLSQLTRKRVFQQNF
jgi:hypothetical protein